MTTPVRIAQVVGNMDGGVESVLMNYFRHIDRSRFLFDFFVSRDTSVASFTEIKSLGGRIFVLPSCRRLGMYLHEAQGFFRLGRYPIVHAHTNSLSVFPLLAAKHAGVPVRIAHNHTTSSPAEFTRNIAKKALRPFARTYPTHLFACSAHAGDWLFGQGSDYTVVDNAIDLDAFAYAPQVRASVRAELQIDDSTFVVGFVGRLVTQKNLLFLVDVFDELLRTRPDSLLLLVGAGDQQGKLMNRAQELGLSEKVRFLGASRHVARYMQAFDAFVLPSHYEGLGVAGVEAQASGLPCVFSDALSPEVDVTGNVSFMPLSASPQEWARRLSTETRRVPVDRERLSRYDITRATPVLEDLYQSLLDQI